MLSQSLTLPAGSGNLFVFLRVETPVRTAFGTIENVLFLSYRNRDLSFSGSGTHEHKARRAHKLDRSFAPWCGSGIDRHAS